MDDLELSSTKSSSFPDLTSSEHTEYVNNQRRTIKRSREEVNIESLLEKYSNGISDQLQVFKQDLESKISSLHSDFKADIKKDLGLINSQLKQVHEAQAKLAADHLDLVQRTDTIELKSQTNTSSIDLLNEQISNLQVDLNTILQRDRLQNLEITGIPDKSSENLSTYIINIAKFVGTDMTVQEIEYATRAQPRTRNPNIPRTIIVKLKSRLLKDTIISGVRAKKIITTKDIGISSSQPLRIYINEHLTPSNKLLYLQARKKKAVAVGFEFLWVRDGKIFARRNDHSPVFTIRSPNDLKKIS